MRKRIRARLTERYTLYLAGLAAASGLAPAPDAHRHSPRSWGCWLLDEGGHLVGGSRFHTHSGELKDASRRAYERCAVLLTARGQAQDLIEYDYLAWDWKSRPPV
jgi:hypothetical protein